MHFNSVFSEKIFPALYPQLDQPSKGRLASTCHQFKDLTNHLKDEQWNEIRSKFPPGTSARVILSKFFEKLIPNLNAFNIQDPNGLVEFQKNVRHLNAKGIETISTILHHLEDLGDEASEILTPVLNCLAASTNSYAISKLLIQKGANPNQLSKTGFSSLHYSAAALQKNLCELFVKEGAQTGVQNINGSTPSHLAAMACQATGEINETFVYLATKSPEHLLLKDHRSKTPLDYIPPHLLSPLLNRFAREQDSRPVCALLIQKGADVNYVEPETGMTALHKSAFSMQKDLCALLVDHGADLRVKDTNLHTPLQLAAMASQVTGKFNKAFIYLATKTPELLQIKDNNSKTPLDYIPSHLFSLCLLFAARENNSLDLCKLLLQRGADVNYAQRVTGLTPLHNCAYSMQGTLCKLFLEHGADPNVKDAESNTPLDIAAFASRLAGTVNPAFIYLATNPKTDLSYRIEGKHLAVDFLPKELLSPFLHRLAQAQNSLGICKQLLARGANVNYKGTGDYTPLHNSAMTQQKELCELFITNGADPNAQGKDGRTPLHVAAIASHVEGGLMEETFQFLLSLPHYNHQLTDKHGKTALDYVIASQGLTQIAQDLEKERASAHQPTPAQTPPTLPLEAPFSLEIDPRTIHLQGVIDTVMDTQGIVAVRRRPRLVLAAEATDYSPREETREAPASSVAREEGPSASEVDAHIANLYNLINHIDEIVGSPGIPHPTASQAGPLPLAAQLPAPIEATDVRENEEQISSEGEISAEEEAHGDVGLEEIENEIEVVEEEEEALGEGPAIEPEHLEIQFENLCLDSPEGARLEVLRNSYPLNTPLFIFVQEYKRLNENMTAGEQNEVKDNLMAILHCAPIDVRATFNFDANTEADFMNPLDSTNTTLLHLAARFKFLLPVAVLLIEKGAQIDVEDVRGETPAHIAARHLNSELWKWLHRQGTNLNQANRYGHTPFKEYEKQLKEKYKGNYYRQLAEIAWLRNPHKQ